MNMVFIYGPPATGKLTVATALSKLTNYPVFHNHLTRDLVQSIYADTLQDHYDLVEILREDIMTYCAIHGTSLIFTMVYDGPEDDKVVAERTAAITRHGGTVHFVELTAPNNVLLDRVGNSSRRQHNKIVDKELLASLLQKNPYSSVLYENVLKIDTSTMDAAQASAVVAEHYKLI